MQSGAIWPVFREVDVDAGLLPRSEVVAPPATWVKRPPFVALDLDGQRVDLPRDDEVRTSAAKVLSTFEDATLAFSQCLLVDDELHCALAGMNEYWARSVAGQPEGHAWKEATGLFLENGRVGLRCERWTAGCRHEGRTLLATAAEPANWGLFTVDTLQAAVHFHDNRDRYDAFLCTVPGPNFLRLLSMAGIRDEDLVPHDPFVAHDLQHVSVFRRTHRDLYLHEDEHQVFQALGRAALADRGPGPQRVFLSRARRSELTPDHRRLVEEGALATGLAERGFAIVDPELLDPAEQMRLMASADVVVGLGGAGMFNTVYCRPGTRVLDIESTPHFVDVHTNLFASAGLDYGVVLGREDGADATGGHKRWHVDVDLVLEVADEHV